MELDTNKPHLPTALTGSHHEFVPTHIGGLILPHIERPTHEELQALAAFLSELDATA